MERIKADRIMFLVNCVPFFVSCERLHPEAPLRRIGALRFAETTGVNRLLHYARTLTGFGYNG